MGNFKFRAILVLYFSRRVNIHKVLGVEKEEEQRKRCRRSDFEKGLVNLNRNPAESELVLSQNLLAMMLLWPAFPNTFFILARRLALEICNIGTDAKSPELSFQLNFWHLRAQEV